MITFSILMFVLKDDILDFEAIQLRSDSMNGALIARTATKLSSDLLKQFVHCSS